MKKKRRFCLEKSDLMYMAACWSPEPYLYETGEQPNADPYLIETDEQIDKIWDEIRIYGFHQIEQPSEDYETACLQLDIDPKACYPVFESDIFTCKFGGLLESV